MIRAVTLLVLLSAAPAFSQTSSADDKTTLGGTFSAAILDALPTGENPFALIETLEPAIVSDRFSNGGLFAGQPARLGGFLGSWTQTVFRVGDVDITEPNGSGAPLLFPDLALWQRVDVATALHPPEINTTGTSISFEPRRPTLEWARVVAASTSHFGSPSSTVSQSEPPIVRLNSWDRASILASGPLFGTRWGRDRLGAVLAASWTRGTQYHRAAPPAVEARAGTAFAHVVFTPDDQHEVRTVAWINRGESPFEQWLAFSRPDAVAADASAHVQATFDRHPAAGMPFRLFGGYGRRGRRLEIDPAAPAVFERLRDGSLEQLASIASRTTTRRWTIGGALTPRPFAVRGGVHRLQTGITVSGVSADGTSFYSGAAGELVDGIPARVWLFSNAGVESRRGATLAAVHARDRIELSPALTVDAGLRFDAASGSAAGATGGIEWRSWLPSAQARWRVSEARPTTVFAGYRRAAYRLALDLLAIGDPGAPTAGVYRWDPAADGSLSSLTLRGPLVARAGPGTGGNAGFSEIGGRVRRPSGEEVVLGLDVRLAAPLLVRLAGVARRERHLLGLLNVGTPASSYTTFTVADPGGNVLDPGDDQVITVFNRRPESFGADRYLLTNAPDDATFKGVELSFAYTADRVVVFGGATAGMAVAHAASRGFGPVENDHTIPGERLANPNAATLAEGRLFPDRAYTAKLATVLRLPADVRLGAIARYQDGQAFARMLVFRGLNQGAEAVRAFTNGESRFRFTGTLDLRLQKGIVVGRARADAILDAYNLLDLSYEVEENSAQLPDVRVGTAVQPPRAFHFGVRVSF